ncbi:MAG: polyprenyl synthetase family protein [Candidatus Spyradenecus sp.]
MNALFASLRAQVERALDDALAGVSPEARAYPGGEAFQAALEHALKGGGKRVRPILTLLCAQACGAQAGSEAAADALRAATAIELLHSYTLVHDDLPSMDNDTERRGAPSVWAKFGEGQAVLAGDYLQALAFAQLAPCRRAADLLPLLTRAATQVIHGQVSDIAAAQMPSADWTPALVGYVFTNKTAELIRCACALGAAAAGAPEAVREALADYGTHVGLAFQYVDDLLDAQQSQVGNELNALAVYGGETEAVRETATYYTKRALKALEAVPGDTAALADFAAALLERLA